MKFTPQSIADVILIEPNVHYDERGYFMESFRHNAFEKAIGYKDPNKPLPYTEAS